MHQTEETECLDSSILVTRLRQSDNQYTEQGMHTNTLGASRHGKEQGI